MLLIKTLSCCVSNVDIYLSVLKTFCLSFLQYCFQYFADNERIVLIDQAKVIQNGNTFEGEKIVYDTQRQIVNAGRATGSNVTTPKPRIDMLIQPKKKTQPQQGQTQ